MTLTEVETVKRIERAEAPALAAEEYRRLATVAQELTPEDWSRPTDCPEWTVRELLAHVAGAMAGTSLREGARQRKVAGARAKASGRTFLDAMNEMHIEERAARSNEEVARELRELSGPAVRARRRVPGPMRRMPIPNSPDGLTLGHLLDVILTRDVWMHRVDVCRATDRPFVLTPQHDGRLVADVVREWADKHGEPFTLRLTGPAGGAFTRSPGDADLKIGAGLEFDAVEFCRILSGRGAAEGLLATEVVF